MGRGNGGEDTRIKKQPELQKIEVYGGPTTKEIKKKHPSRPIGGAETGSWGRENSQQGNGRMTE